MRYQVPQFIEVEDKIFGPLTFKQFVYLAGSGGVCIALYTLLPLYFAILFGLPFVAAGLALAFYKVNDRPFIVVIEHAFKYFMGSKLYLWRPRPATNTEAQDIAPVHSKVAVPPLSESKLRDLAWSLNIKDQTQMGVIDAEKPGVSM